MRTIKFAKFTKLWVLWEDTVSNSDWHRGAEIDKANTVMVQSLGYFLGNKKRSLRLAHSVTDDAESDYTLIPWGCVRDVKLLKRIVG